MKHRSKKRREKCYILIFKKRHMKEEKDIAPMDFAEYLRKSEVSGHRKVYWNERYCYISQRRWDVQYLEKSVSHWLLVERWEWNWMIKLFYWSLYYALIFYKIINVNIIISLFNMLQVNAFSTCFVFVKVAVNHRHVICKRYR